MCLQHARCIDCRSTWICRLQPLVCPSKHKMDMERHIRLKLTFNSEYKQTTGWDKNGPPIPSDPLFVDFGYHIGTNSPARNAGDNSECALTDIDGNTRPLEYTCDIGADEFEGLNNKHYLHLHVYHINSSRSNNKRSYNKSKNNKRC
ncbi:MAG: hypothetical protein KatS3mg078_1291 [Deltaproteobacteria bacterium]|nr:MAG: hypothetical protein KatS3mg078_1291 [Deltaproteobacteria bacterium]